MAKTNYHYLQLQDAILEVSVAISRRKNEYHSGIAQELSHPNANTNTLVYFEKIL